MGTARRAAAHPGVAAVLAAGEISESFARTICTWTGKLPQDCREAADAILLTAAKGGADLRDLAGLAAEIYARSLPADPGKKQDQAFEDRCVRLETTFGGAGVLSGDLSPECAAVVGTVLDALSARAGAEDTRSQAQRCHDALAGGAAAAGGRRAAARAGRAAGEGLGAHLAGRPDGARRQLGAGRGVDGAGPGAVGRAPGGGLGGGSDGGAWLDGDAAGAIACDAAMAPVVTGDVNPAALDDLVRLCVDLDRLRHHPRAGQDDPGAAAGPGDGRRRRHGRHRRRAGRARPGHHPRLGGAGARDHRQGRGPALRPGRAGVLPAPPAAQRPAGRPSLPLDIGYSETIPASIRNAVILRDKHCQWAGRCNQPAAACQVHHVKHKANGGKTSTRDCVLLCFFHHQVAIHRWGWTLVLNPDGTTTAWNPDKTKVLHSHSPPARPG